VIHGVERQWTLRNVIWEAVNKKPFPQGYTLRHRDGDKANLRYDNLELVLLAEVRREAPTVFRRGDGRTAKLTAADAAAIRSSAESTSALAQRYGVHRSTIIRVRSGETWGNG